MTVSMERKRQACFAWLDQAHRTAQVRHLPLFARGNVVRDRDWTPAQSASDEKFSRAAGTRGADALAVLANPTVAVRKVSPVLVSPGRFMAWYLPRFMARTVPMPAPARDASAAVLQAGLADVARVGRDRYLVTPRDAVPQWEYDGLKAPHVTPRVQPFYGTPVALYGRLAPHEYQGGLASYVARSMVPVAIVEQSAADPMRYFPQASALQRQARVFLAEHGEKMALPDVFDTKKMRWHSRPDRVAHRGTARVARRAPMRYEHGWAFMLDSAGKPVLNSHGKKRLVPMLDNVAIGADGQYELTTTLARRYYCTCGPITLPANNAGERIELAPTGGFQHDVRKCQCQPTGWRGHRRETFPRARQAVRAVAQASKVKAGRRAPNSAGPWTYHPAALVRATRTLTDQVAALENLIRSAGDGSTVRFADGTRVVVHGAAQVFDGERLRMYPVREWCRRTVLATLAQASE